MRRKAQHGRNDLERFAIEICPAIAEILAAMEETYAWVARMSGSGGTCFALFDDPSDRDEASRLIADAHPEWWTMIGALR